FSVCETKRFQDKETPENQRPPHLASGITFLSGYSPPQASSFSGPRWKSPPMWPSGVGSRQACPRESALRRAAISGNINALPPHHVPTGRSVRVFICANPDGKA
ncbi:hypothetical protein XENOCAPTIV_017727, partial [Xenoophorus captivus]